MKRHDIPYVMVSRERYRTFGPETSQHPLLGPLLALVDEGRVSSVATVDVVGGNVGADGAHFTPAGHARIAERVLEESAGALAPERALDPVSEAVVAFFEELPFNFHASDEAMRRSLGETDPVTSHMPDLARVAARSDVSRALDVGCGAGWLAFTLAGHLGLEVEAIDLCRPALARARRMARHVGVDDRVRIREASVFDLEGDGAYDLTLAMGVLHHTRDPREALARMVAATRPGGFVHVGLYHRPSRGVFLDELRRVVRQEGEERAFELFRALAPAKADDVRHARSWFRAQLHVPHESHHTLAEVAGWFEELGVELCSTSLNRFADLRSPEELEALEADYVDTVRTAVHEERRFLPGFFTALGRR
ncbi:MAG: class I SAM-dependent methyltransferase, partial [Planctomycetota bacterium]